MYIYILLFWWNNIHALFFFWHILLLVPASEIDTTGNWWEKPYIVHGVWYTIGWESGGKKYTYFGESIGTNFQGSLNSIDFAAFSNAIGNWWGNLSISHARKYIKRWEAGWRNAPILWEKYVYQFPRLSPGLCYIFPCYGKLMGKETHAFLIGWVYRRMGI